MIKVRLLLLADRMDWRARQAARVRQPGAPCKFHFNLAGWGSRNECGTTACAIGDATQMGAFRRRGLKEHPHWAFAPVFAGDSGWRAVMKFFGLTSLEASYLFASQNYSDPASPALVAERLRAFVKQRRIPSGTRVCDAMRHCRETHYV